MFGQFHSVSRKHLQRYVDEFCYRYNLRNANPCAAFDRTINLGLGGGGMSSDFPLKVIAGTADRPLIINDIEIPCYVLGDETRVLSQSGFLTAIGRSPTPTAGMGGMSNFEEMPYFLRAECLEPFISNELRFSTTPVLFRLTSGQRIVGYNALLLPQVCDVYLKARNAGALLPSQVHIAERAAILVRGLATVGIIALVDEATGYQRLREARALATILEKCIAKELQPWTKTFPHEFYSRYSDSSGGPALMASKGPVLSGTTSGCVCKRLALGVLDELRELNPRLSSGYRCNRHHQWFTPEAGHPKLNLKAALPPCSNAHPIRSYWKNPGWTKKKWRPDWNTTYALSTDG